MASGRLIAAHHLKMRRPCAHTPGGVTYSSIGQKPCAMRRAQRATPHTVSGEAPAVEHSTDPRSLNHRFRQSCRTRERPAGLSEAGFPAYGAVYRMPSPSVEVTNVRALPGSGTQFVVPAWSLYTLPLTPWA